MLSTFISVHNDVNVVRDLITFNNKIPVTTKTKLLSVIDNSDFVPEGVAPDPSKRFKIQVNVKSNTSMVHQILHEILHIFFGHLGVSRVRCHGMCECENYLMDIIVESYIARKFELNNGNNINELRTALTAKYALPLEETNSSLLGINCNNCANSIKQIAPQADPATYVTAVKSSDKLIQELKRKISKFTNKKTYAVKHRNYVTNDKMFIPTRKNLKSKIYVIVDTSTSISKVIVDSIIQTCTKYNATCDDVKIVCFSDVIYTYTGKVRHVNTTNFESVYKIYGQKDNVILISDLDFTEYQHSLLNRTKFEVINTCYASQN